MSIEDSQISKPLKVPIINPTAVEIERIVRRVLATLTGDAASLSSGSSEAYHAPATLRLSDQVISMQSVKDRIRGMQTLEISKSAVLTPAARDYCREMRVNVVRGSASRSTPVAMIADAARLQRLLVVGTPVWMPAIAKQLCNRQAHVEETIKDDASVLRSVADGLRAGHQAAVAIVHSPYAVCWQAARDDRLRPAVVPNWSELNEVLNQVPVNLLILSSQSWNVPAVCNGARRFFQHLQNQS